MRAVGVIAEYNPFHNGHAWQLGEAKKRTGADLAVVAMSGNFVQRGEPAIVDKWFRADQALQNGADLVVEIPFHYAVQAGDYFAQAGVQILTQLKCQDLAFGVEKGEASQIMDFAQTLVDKEDQLDRVVQGQSSDLSYAKTMALAFENLGVAEENGLDFFQPNNLLGLLYSREILKQGSGMSIHPITRKQAQHKQNRLEAGQAIASGTAIRQALLSDRPQSALAAIPGSSHTILDYSLRSWQQAYSYLNYQVLVQDHVSLREIYQMVEGIEYRLKRVSKTAETFEKLMTQLKSKRYTWTRLQRLMVYTLLQVKEKDMQVKLGQDLDRVRLLGFTSKGRTYLSQIKNTSDLDTVSRLGQADQDDFMWDIRSGEVYNMMVGLTDSPQDFKRQPIIKEKP